MYTKRRVSPSEIRAAAELATNKFQHVGLYASGYS